MIRLTLPPLNTVQDAQALLQTAIGVEFGTLPPYLYALYSIRPGTNAQAEALIKSVVLQEMIHLCLACNMLNALGGNPVLRPQTYPGPLPGDIGPNGTPLTLHLIPFSQKAMEQAMAIEQPEEMVITQREKPESKQPENPLIEPPKNPPQSPAEEQVPAAPTQAVTIGEFYAALDLFLETLPPNAWEPGVNQIVDSQFFPGQIFAINNYSDAHQAIQDIVSEGEGTWKGAGADPLDFQGEYAHFYRFGEIYHNQVLTQTKRAPGYKWGPGKLDVDWSGVYPAITDPGAHDFSQEPPEAQAAQAACNQAFSAMVDALHSAVTGRAGALGKAVRAMFALRMAARHAFTVPLKDPSLVAGPAFLYFSNPGGEPA